MKKETTTILLAFLVSLILTSCHDEEDKTPSTNRTVVIYMSGENNLGTGGYLSKDYDEILEGAKKLPDNVSLLVYIDTKDSNNPPYISLIDRTEGAKTVRQYESDFYSSDPTNMKEVLQWCYSQYPAKSYGLVLWGHSNGWLFEPDESSSTAKANNRRLLAYGADTGQDHTSDYTPKWMNITEMADVLASVPHLDFIFSDCCCMQCAEIAYELRNVCDYLIGSPAEIPGSGAPYDYVVPDLFASKDSVGIKVTDDYIAHGNFGSNSGLPMSVVKTAGMESLAYATQQALSTFMPSYQYPTEIPLDSIIYYLADKNLSARYPVNYDMRNFMRRYLTDADFSTWDNVFQQAVVYSVHPGDIRTTGKNDWMTDTDNANINFTSFYLTDDNYGGMSMFIPQNNYSQVKAPYTNPNVSIFLTGWSLIVDWAEWGW